MAVNYLPSMRDAKKSTSSKVPHSSINLRLRHSLWIFLQLGIIFYSLVDSLVTCMGGSPLCFPLWILLCVWYACFPNFIFSPFPSSTIKSSLLARGYLFPQTNSRPSLELVEERNTCFSKALENSKPPRKDKHLLCAGATLSFFTHHAPGGGEISAAPEPRAWSSGNW